MQADEGQFGAEPGAAAGTTKGTRLQPGAAAAQPGPQSVPDRVPQSSDRVPQPSDRLPQSSDRVPQSSDRVPRRADRVPWLVALGVFAAYTTLSVLRLWQLDPASWDLGIFTEYVKQYAGLHAPVVDIKGAGFNLLGDHFHPMVALIAPFFRLLPTPVTLLVAQAALAAVSVIPVSRAAAARLGTGAGRAIGAAYGLSWGLQQMVDNDFHEIAFAVPLLACSLSALACGRRRATALWALPLVFVKEDQGLTVAAIGVIMIVLARRRARTAGSPGQDPDAPETAARETPAQNADARGGDLWGPLLIAWGLGWSYLAVTVIIPHFNPAHQYPYWSLDGPATAGGHIALSLLPGQLLAAPSAKLPTLVLILLATAFLAVRSPIALAAIPGLVLRFLSTDSAYWGTAWHYNATVMPIVFVAAIDGLARIRAARMRGTASRLGLAVERHGPAVMLAICGALAFQFPLSNLWNPQTYAIDGQVRAADAAMARVPDGVTVETDLGLLAPLAARTDTFWLGTPGNPPPQYIVFDSGSTDFQPPPASVPEFISHRHPGVAYRETFRDDGVYVFRRIDATG
jgi:uncharacterized membrane protein